MIRELKWKLKWELLTVFFYFYGVCSLRQKWTNDLYCPVRST